MPLMPFNPQRVAMADAAGMDFDQEFAAARLRNRALDAFELATGTRHHHRSHVRHVSLLSGGGKSMIGARSAHVSCVMDYGRAAALSHRQRRTNIRNPIRSGIEWQRCSDAVAIGTDVPCHP
jgi:hypothetical protein